MRLRIAMYPDRIVRTTIDLPDHLLAHAEQLAAERNVPLKRLVEESVRLYLREHRGRRSLPGLGPRTTSRPPGR